MEKIKPIQELIKVDFDKLENKFEKEYFQAEDDRKYNENNLKFIIKHKLEALISNTPTGDLRNELSDINIYFNFL